MPEVAEGQQPVLNHCPLTRRFIHSTFFVAPNVALFPLIKAHKINSTNFLADFGWFSTEGKSSSLASLVISDETSRGQNGDSRPSSVGEGGLGRQGSHTPSRASSRPTSTSTQVTTVSEGGALRQSSVSSEQSVSSAQTSAGAAPSPRHRSRLGEGQRSRSIVDEPLPEPPV